MSRAVVSGIGPASALAYGNLSPANFSQVNNWFGKAIFNVLDYGADPTGTNDNAAAINAAIAAATAANANGGQVFFPPGTYKLGSAITVAATGICFVGASANAVNIMCTSATADMFVVNAWYVGFYNLTFTTNINKTAGVCVNAPQGYDYCIVAECNFSGQSSGIQLFTAINMSNLVMIVRDIRMIFVGNAYVVVNAASNANQYIHGVLASNAAQATLGGIYVQQTGSLTISDCDIVQGGPGALYLTAATGVSIPSVVVSNSYFDTSTNGLTINNAGTGNVVRAKFTNCWFGNNTTAGVNIIAAGGGIDGVTFSNCDFYNNATGFLGAVACGGSVDVLASRFAGNTTAGINFAAGNAATYYKVADCHIGAQAGFGANAIGIVTATATFGGVRIENNYCEGNTSNFTLGTVTCANWSNFRITDNAGINPKGAVTTPAIGASPATIVNNTGFRCVVSVSTAGTLTALSFNGVAAVTTVQTAGNAVVACLDPGGTIGVTYSVVPVYKWVAN